ncbi:MAG: hypothetical protein IBX43_01870 [Campylobacterales bacterium]|nr:hypothetical protein [Campylobacterales bacterium]
MQPYTHLLRSFFIISRVMLFEKFTPVFFFFYLLFVLSLGFVLSVIHWGVGVFVVLLCLLLFRSSLQSFEFLKRLLIRKGDRVEYADPSAEQTQEIFKKARVLLKMRPSEAEKSKLIDAELLEGNRHFFLVQIDKKPSVIAYEWIVGLSPEMLD